MPSALSGGDVTSVQITISAADIATPIVTSLQKTSGVWQGIIGGIPAGANRTFLGEAFNASSTLIFQGSVSGVTVSKGATALVALNLQQVPGSPTFGNQVPIISALVASTNAPPTSDPVSLTVTANDPDGTPLTYLWSATGGFFSSTTAATTIWTSPATDGVQTITVTVTDAALQTTSMSVSMSVAAANAVGSGQVTVTLNTRPLVSSIVANPTRIDVGGTTALTLTASDADGDTLSYAWSADCTGSFSDPTAKNPSFTLSAPLPGDGNCQLSVTVSDPTSLLGTGSITIQTAPAISAIIAPQIDSTWQSATAAPSITLSVDAHDPQASALTFTWSATGGSLSGQIDTAGSSDITWSTGGALASVTCTVSNALGASKSVSFAVGGAPIEHLVTSGQLHSCSTRGAGTVTCWGGNGSGQATAPSTLLVKISAGRDFNCGIKSDETLACWGSNDNGTSTPPAGSYTEIGSGIYHSCAIKTDGTMACWGYSGDGQLSAPAGTYLQVASGERHSCAIKSDDTVACWGRNFEGQSSPPAGTFLEVTAGTRNSCGIKSDGTVVCWGQNNQGQSSPPAGTFQRISANRDPNVNNHHVCGIKSDGTLACWGNNALGQLSAPAGTYSNLSAGALHTCAVKSDDTVVCWGDNGNGQSSPPGGS
jgi:hypothetical protein